MKAVAASRAGLVGAVLAALALAAAGCGSDEGESVVAADGETADASAFPAPDGRTLGEIAEQEATVSELVVAPAGQVFHEGTNRLGFGVFTIDRATVPDADVALYAARPDKPAVGPFPATVHPLDVDAAFQSETTALDPDAAEVVYAAEVELDGKGEWRLMALVRDGDGFGFTNVPSAVVGAFPDVPQEGEKAPVIDTPTGEDVGGDLSKIDTRQPPSTMHDVSFEDAVGEQPIVLLFATPALCTSRVCGPVVDITEEVKAERGEEAAFILMEIYEDNVVDEGLRKQVGAYSLPSEPWLFVVDSNGKISTAIEGAFSESELNAALEEVAGQAG